MSIAVKDIPASIKADKNVTPFIVRSVELVHANPVVSYYCKVYVLEHILSQKLHQNGSDVEQFAMRLLDDTEAIKFSHEDESVQKVLQSKQLSINLIFVFAFKLFHGCLEDLKEYDGSTKPALVSKLRATLNFWALFSIFTSDDKETIDYAKTTGGTCSTQEQFVTLCKEKIKTLKYQLSRLLKDEVPIKGEETELEQFTEGVNQSPAPDFPETPSKASEDVFPETPSNDAENDTPEDLEDHSEPHEEKPGSPMDEANFTLPGAPKFDPGLDGDSEINLPGAPKYIADEDTDVVNKNSSIKVIPPSGSVAPKRETIARAESSKSVQVTKADVGAIVDTTEQISKAQKHAKFAISALNYEDLNTAEAELLKGLEILRILKANEH